MARAPDELRLFKSSSTTRIYDRSRDRLTIEEIERVQIGQKQEV